MTSATDLVTDPAAEAVRAAQGQRWRAVDPLLPPPAVPAGPLLTVPDGVGTAALSVLDPGSLNATWTALRSHTLQAWVAGAEPAVALGAILDEWCPDAEPGDEDSVASLVWPSRDTTAVLALARRGFAPVVAVVVRHTGGAVAHPVPGVTVRPLADPDVAAATGLAMELVRFDARFGSVTERPATPGLLAADLATAAAHEEPRAWVAQRNGRIVGLCLVEPPVDADWMAPLCAIRPVAYLSSLVVSPAARSTGIGAALVARADAALQAAGAAVTMLHHGVANPHSAPFWHRQGYRPLWTVWQRRPAVPIRPA